ncbi:MAG: hypothetical protein ABW104_12110, partial [Candidatus Thiodiazotropha sp. 6PLUC2]
GAQEAVLGARNRLTTKLPPNKERKIIDTTFSSGLHTETIINPSAANFSPILTADLLFTCK